MRAFKCGVEKDDFRSYPLAITKASSENLYCHRTQLSRLCCANYPKNEVRQMLGDGTKSSSIFSRVTASRANEKIRCVWDVGEKSESGRARWKGRMKGGQRKESPNSFFSVDIRH